MQKKDSSRDNTSQKNFYSIDMPVFAKGGILNPSQVKMLTL